jgi:hypothetical protein
VTATRRRAALTAAVTAPHRNPPFTAFVVNRSPQTRGTVHCTCGEPFTATAVNHSLHLQTLTRVPKWERGKGKGEVGNGEGEGCTLCLSETVRPQKVTRETRTDGNQR